MNKVANTIVIIVTICKLAICNIDLASFENFQNFQKSYGNIYHSFEELKTKFDTFNANALKINNKFKHLTGITKFSDLTEEEFKNTYLNLKVDEQMNSKASSQFNNKGKFLKVKVDVPEQFDWRSMNAVTGVKNQGECGSSFAFAATSTIESQYFKKTGSLVNFSEQIFINCDENNACNGGSVTEALSFRKLNLASATDMPYTGIKSDCNDSSFSSDVKVNGYSIAGTEDEEIIKEYLFTVGPLAVGMNGKVLKDYRSGIIDLSNEECDQSEINFAVTLVGYGIENGTPFWIAKNSFGSNWGEKGYFRVKRGSSTCGINKFAVSAILS